MNKIIAFLKSTKELSRDVFILSAGILVAQLIPLMIQPFLKRWFTPEDFGTYDVYLKLFSIFVALSSFKYENAILLAKKDSDSKHVLYLSLLISGIIFLIMFFCAIVFNDFFILQLNGFTFFTLILLPISVFSYSLFNIFNMYLIRRQKFLLSSSSKVSRRTSEGFIQLLYGYSNNAKGLIIGDVIGNIVQGVFSFWKVSLITSFKYISYKKLKKVFYEYKELPIYTLIPNILNTFVLGSLTFLILSKFNLQEVGYLEFTQKILSIPSVFISIAISQVVFQRVSQLIIKKQKIIPMLLAVMFMLTFFSLVFVLVIEIYGVYIFTLIGGDEWETSGKYAKILVYGSAVMLIFSPLGKILIALRKFKINSLWEILKFISVVMLFNIERISINEYLKIYTIIIVSFYIVYGFIIIYFSYKYQCENQISTE